MKTLYYKLINVLQGKTARWIEGVTKADGLYTDEITTCKIFIIFGEKDGRRAISLTHYDGYGMLENIKQEYDWFDSVDYFYLLYNPSQYSKPLLNYFNEILLKRLKNILGGLLPEIAEIDPRFDAVSARYDWDRNGERHIGFLKGQALKDYKCVLVNHPRATEMFTHYKINVMFSEIEGDFKHAKLFYIDESVSISPGSYFYRYNGMVLHIMDHCKRLATPIDHQTLMFDGENFLPLRLHDEQFSDFALSIFNQINKEAVATFKDLINQLAEILTKSESQISIRHETRAWIEDSQTLYIAMIYAFLNAMNIPATSEATRSFLNATTRYEARFDREREIELIQHIVRRQEFPCHQRGTFFSPSRYATSEQPYGPYADYPCFEESAALMLTMRLTKLHS
ncbi:MAG: hypothetical protein AB7F64_07690 [Gammaproteobacteria bacterium]